MNKIIHHNIPHIGEEIFKNLSDEDLIKFTHVSKTWKQIAENVVKKRWQNRIIEAASSGEKEDVIKILLMHPGAKDINWNEQSDSGKTMQTHEEGLTALHYACMNGDLGIIKIMLKKYQALEINLNMQTKKGFNGLMFAIDNQHIEVVKLLLNHSRIIKINARDNKGWNAFRWACGTGCVDMVKLFLDHSRKIELNAMGNDGFSGFHIACYKGHSETVELILNTSKAKKIDVGAVNLFGTTGFMWACKNGHVCAVQSILEYSGSNHNDLNVNAQNFDGSTAFIIACSNGHTEVVKLMVNHATRKNMDLNLKSKNGITGFMYACGLGHLDIVETLIDNPIVQVDAKDNSGLTGLMAACLGGKVDVVKLLLDHPRTMNVLYEIQRIIKHMVPSNNTVGLNHNEQEIVTLLKKQEEYLCAKKASRFCDKSGYLIFNRSSSVCTIKRPRIETEDE